MTSGSLRTDVSVDGDVWRGLAALAPAGVRLAAVDPRSVDTSDLFPEERALLPAGDPARTREFAAGRLGARRCLAGLGAPASGPLLSDASGAPSWPEGVRGSITHKPRLCLVAVADVGTVSGIGLDLEEMAPLPRLAWRAVLTEREIERHAGSRGVLDPTRSRLILCAKEAFYKWRCSSGGAPPDLHGIEVDLDAHGMLRLTQPVVASRDQALVPASRPLMRAAHVVARDWSVVLIWSPSTAAGSRPAPAGIRRPAE
ncbi:MAG TPA: 4'-phosphopantetheinyl transferase superfamily protein [Actinomycetes bacterium]|nr:4'-phosphopantetheinyl transferase superfamily protein [Actinomycetes bacterium]